MEDFINVENTNELLNSDSFIFVSYVMGIKGLPFNTFFLLVNNTIDGVFELIYAIDNNKQIMRIPFSDMKSISVRSKVVMQNVSKNVESNETKSMLLSFVIFKGNPLLQILGKDAFNSLFDTISSNYDKVKFDTVYEISIEAIINSEIKTIVFNSDTNPDKFVEIVNKCIG